MDGRILFVDDDKEDRFLIAHAFAELKSGDRVDFLTDGAEVIGYLEAAAPGSVRFIVLDLNMPLLNGTDTLRLLQQHPQLHTIPVLILSTSVNTIEQERCVALGAVGFREKPVRFNEYVSFCREILAMAF